MALVGVSAALIGCDDTRSADRRVQNDLNRGIELAQQGTEQSIKQAQQVLETAASDSAASPATRANAKALLAQTELENARNAQREADRLQIELARLVWQADELGLQIGTTNALVAGYRKYDPQEARANIEKAIADATGGPEKPAWFTHENTTLPTLAAVRQVISRLEGEIAQHNDKIKELTTQRDRALADSEQQSRIAQSGRRGEHLDAFRQASELRKRAADLTTAINVEQAALIPLQRDLATAQAQQSVLEEVIAQLQAQGAALENGWKTVQQQIGAQATIASSILQGNGESSPVAASGSTTAGSIASKGAEIERLVAQLKTLRDQAMNDARNASTHYDEATKAANDLRSQLQAKINELGPERAESKAWSRLISILSPSIFQLQQSAAQRTLASLYASRAVEYGLRITLRNSLAPALQAAGLAMPPSLQATNLEADREQAIKDASEAYAEANRLLENVAEGQRDETLTNAAQVARILTLYNWSMLERQANDARSADDHLQLAIQFRNAALDQNISLPNLPAGLGPRPNSAEPTTAPAAEGETAPATEPATTEPS